MTRRRYWIALLGCVLTFVGTPGLLIGQVDQATALVQRDSNNAQMHYLLGLALVGAARYDSADASFRTAMSLDSRLADAYLALAYLPYLRRSQLSYEERRRQVPKAWQPRLEEAHRMYRRAFVIDPLVSLRPLSVLFPQGRWQSRDFTSDASKFYELFVEGFDDLAAGRYREAFERLDQLAKRVYFADRNPNGVPEFILWARGMAAARIGRSSAAIADFQALLDRAVKKEQQPQLVPVPLRTNEYRYILAVLYQRAADTARAGALLREAAEADLGLDMAHVRLAEMHRARGDFSNEMQERQRAVQANPEDATLLLELAMLRYEAGELEEAEDELSRGAALRPRDARLPYLMGIIAQAQQRRADARARFERCLALAGPGLGHIARDARARLSALQ